MRLGAHESTSGGLHEAFPRALADGAEALQIFTKSSRMWRSKEITGPDVALFHAAAKSAGFSASVHASYLINLGCVSGDLREKSIEAFIDELQRCDRIGAPYLIVHHFRARDRDYGPLFLHRLRHAGRALLDVLPHRLVADAREGAAGR